MSGKMWLIVILFGLNLWGLAFYATRTGYREAHEAGLMPNLHFRNAFDRVM